MVELLTPLALAVDHPSPRVIRPLRAGDIVSLPHLSAIGHYDGTVGFDDIETVIEWAIPPDGPQSALPQSFDEADAMLESGELVIRRQGEYLALQGQDESNTWGAGAVQSPN